MASTYDNSLRLELIATGEAASTWGDKTNVNLTAIAAAFGYATQDGFAADANATTTVADGAADPARALYFKITSSATLTATRTLTIAPNTISRVMWIENATTGSQSIAISQGSGANVTIPAGKTAVVYLDGAGAGAAVVDAMASLNIDGSISAGAATFSGEITANGGIALGDNDKATFGDGDDLQIYHSGTHSYIQDAGTGSLRLVGADIEFLNADFSDFFAKFANNGASTFYYDGSAKLATTAAGIDVTGFVVSDGMSTNTSGTSNLVLGVNAGNSIIAGGNYNVLVGDGAGTAITTGDNNVAVGFESLKASTTSSSNTAVGRKALTANTTGNSNTAVGLNSQLLVVTGSNNTSLGVEALRNNTASNNTAVGYSALLANTTGTRNTAVGVNAGDAITTASYNSLFGTHAGSSITTGNVNSAFGDYALSANTIGAQNTAVGQAALTANTTASNNTAVGYAALLANTTGYDNTAVGAFALDSNTIGSLNTAVGQSALQANTADSNNAFGRRALYTNTTGSQNTALGYLALYLNSTASYNTAVGNQALQNNSTGANNTSIGFLSLYSNTTGASNVAVGVGSLDANTTASNNTAVGYEALGANTTGTRNSALGTKSGDEVTTGADNTVIGYAAATHVTNLSTGSRNTLIGAYAHTSSFNSVEANGFGYDINAVAGYTTIGSGTQDIRAAHGAAIWNGVSDERYKKDIVDSTAGLSFINALQPRTYKYRTLGELPETFRAYEEGSTKVFKNSETNHGFIAQEVKAAIDADSSIKDGFRLWDERDDGSQEVGEAALIPVLVKAIQELTARLETLEG